MNITKCINQNPPQPTKKKPKGGKPRLQVTVHGIPVHTPWKRDIKYPVCKQVFHLVKNVNLHVKQYHPQFRYKCKYCTNKFKFMPAGTNMKENMEHPIISASTAKRDFSSRRTSLFIPICIPDKADFDALIVLIITTPEL